MNLPFQIPQYRPWFAVAMGLALLSQFKTDAQPYLNGDLTPNIAFNPRHSEASFSLKDNEDQIVILAFFTQWCRSCRTTLGTLASELEQRENANSNGLPIKLISVNLEPEDSELTDQFIMDLNLEVIIDDFGLNLWNTFSESNGIPLFVVINGIKRSPSHREWEVVHKQLGTIEADTFFSILDTIQASDVPAPLNNPFEGIPSDPFGWREIPWFGRFNDTYFPWIHHENHEWLYVSRQSNANKIVAYQSATGWLSFTASDSPQVFNFARNTWMQPDPLSTGVREFFDQSAEEWLSFPTEKEAQPGGRNGFQYTNALIPTSEIRSGGPPRDGIPALSDPSFVSQFEAASYMQDDDVVISVTHDNETRAYPFRILNWHEIVNDQIGNLHFAATYCPLCGTAIVFDRKVNNRILTFGVSGLLYLDNVLMFDRQTESLWSQLFLQSVTGSQFGTPLTFVPSDQMLYKSWRERFPKGSVLSNSTGHNRNYNVDPYADYFQDPDPLFPVGDIRNDLEPKAWVFGVLVDDFPIAFARDQLPSGQLLEETVNGKQITILYDEPSQNIQVTDPQTGQQLTGLWSFWFAWQAFHPTTDLWTGETQ